MKESFKDAVLINSFEKAFGIITSVSIFAVGIGAAAAVSCINLSMVSS